MGQLHTSADPQNPGIPQFPVFYRRKHTHFNTHFQHSAKGDATDTGITAETAGKRWKRRNGGTTQIKQSKLVNYPQVSQKQQQKPSPSSLQAAGRAAMFASVPALGRAAGRVVAAGGKAKARRRALPKLAAIEVTPAAADRIKALLAKAPDAQGIRLGVRTRTCVVLCVCFVCEFVCVLCVIQWLKPRTGMRNGCVERGNGRQRGCGCESVRRCVNARYRGVLVEVLCVPFVCV